jgi:hypothetical protein
MVIKLLKAWGSISITAIVVIGCLIIAELADPDNTTVEPD